MCKTSLAKCSVVRLQSISTFSSPPSHSLHSPTRALLTKYPCLPSNHHRSISIHPLRCDTQRHQARLPPLRTPSLSTRALRALCKQGESWVPGRTGTGWCVSGNDGRGAGQRWSGMCCVVRHYVVLVCGAMLYEVVAANRWSIDLLGIGGFKDCMVSRNIQGTLPLDADDLTVRTKRGSSAKHGQPVPLA